MNGNLLQLCWGGEEAGNRWMSCCVICGGQGDLYPCNGCPRQFHSYCLLKESNSVAIREAGGKQEVRLFCGKCQRSRENERRLYSQESCNIEYAQQLQQETQEVISLCSKLPKCHPGKILGEQLDQLMEGALHPSLRYLEAKYGGVRELNNNEDLEVDGKVPYDDPLRFLTYRNQSNSQSSSYTSTYYNEVSLDRYLESKEEEMSIAQAMGAMAKKGALQDLNISSNNRNNDQNEFDYLVKNEKGRATSDGGWGVQEVNAAPYGEGVKEALGRDGICMPSDCFLTQAQVVDFQQSASFAYKEAWSRINSYDGLPEDLENRGFQEIRMLFYNRWELEVEGVRSRFQGPNTKPFPWNKLMIDILGCDAQLYDAGMIVTNPNAPHTVPRPLEFPPQIASPPPKFKSNPSSMLVLVKLQDSHPLNGTKEDLVVEAHMGTHRWTSNQSPNQNLKIKRLRVGAPVGRAVILDGRLNYNFLTPEGTQNQMVMYLLYGIRDIQILPPRSKLPRLPLFTAQDPRSVLGGTLTHIKNTNGFSQMQTLDNSQNPAVLQQYRLQQLCNTQKVGNQQKVQQQQQRMMVKQDLIPRARTGQPTAPRRVARAMSNQPILPQMRQKPQTNGKGTSNGRGINLTPQFNQLICSQSLGQMIGGGGALMQLQQFGGQESQASLQLQLQQQQLLQKKQQQQGSSGMKVSNLEQVGWNVLRSRSGDMKQDDNNSMDMVDLTLDDTVTGTCGKEFGDTREPPLKRMKTTPEVAYPPPLNLQPKAQSFPDQLISQPKKQYKLEQPGHVSTSTPIPLASSLPSPLVQIDQEEQQLLLKVQEQGQGLNGMRNEKLAYSQKGARGQQQQYLQQQYQQKSNQFRERLLAQVFQSQETVSVKQQL